VRRVVSVAVVVAALGLVGPGAQRGVSATASVGACTDLLSASTVQRVLGVASARISGPEVFGPRRCGWHSADATCTLRSLGVEVIAADQAAHVTSLQLLANRVDGLGDRAYFASPTTQVGMGAQIERLFVRDGGTWYRFSILGRLGERGRDLLVDVATEVVARASS
jgi:hypothetical protein